MTNFWNDRYKEENYAYGKLPNVFFKEELEKIQTKGNILLPAEGEGRNAVYASSLGWSVVAFDPSLEGKKKAEALAKKHRVQLEYLLLGYQDMNFAPNSFDAIGLTYTHMPPSLRPIIHAKYVELLKPGGKLILEAFSKEQINYNSGGPGDIAMLFSEQELTSDFKDLKIEKIATKNRELNEGDFHKGIASVIQLVARK